MEAEESKAVVLFCGYVSLVSGTELIRESPELVRGRVSTYKGIWSASFLSRNLHERCGQECSRGRVERMVALSSQPVRLRACVLVLLIRRLAVGGVDATLVPFCSEFGRQPLQ